MQTEKELTRYTGNEASVTCVYDGPDGQVMDSSALDNKVRLLEFARK